jgi:hypothetical protein
MDFFLDVKEKVWKIGDLTIPVNENVPMKDLMWFRTATKEIHKKQESGKLTQSEALEFDDIWWDKTCNIGLGKTKEEIIDTGITESQFRNLMAEVFHFLTTFGNVEEAKQSGLYDPEIQKKRQEDFKITPSSLE